MILHLKYGRGLLKRQSWIYWKHNTKQYVPDFVVEAENAIYMIETKQSQNIESEEVQDKKKAALEFCRYASEYTTEHSGKIWSYVIIPHDSVMINMGFATLVNKYKLDY